MTTSLEKRRELGCTSAAPFYSLPTRKTSAQIIAEARQDITLKEGGVFAATLPRTGVRTVNTKRPFTPRCQERTLFGTPAALRGERPPSSFTLSPLQFDPNDPSGRTTVLAEIREGWLEDSSSTPPPRLPALTRRPSPQTASRRLSLGDLPEERDDGEGQQQEPLEEVTVYDLDCTLEDAALRTLLKDRPLKKAVPQLHPIRKTSLPAPLEATDASTYTSLPPDALLTDPREASTSPRTKLPSWAADSLKSNAEPGRAEPGGIMPGRLEQVGVEQKGDGQLRERSEEEQALIFEQKIAPVLDEITRAVASGVSEAVLGELVEKLYGQLVEQQLVGRQALHRSSILRVVFRLVDREHGGLLAALARVMLALRVSGNNLTSVMKLVFKVTRDAGNDELFLTGPLLGLLLEAVGRLSPLESAEAAVYGYGALKFLTMNSALCTRLLARGVIELLTLHMMIIVNEMEERGSVPQQTGYALVQLTATLRHVSSSERAYPQLLQANTVQQACRLLAAFQHDADITANLARILRKQKVPKHQLPANAVGLSNEFVMPASSVRNIGIQLDSEPSINSHIAKVTTACFGALRRIRSLFPLSA
ncbi:armadillo repeat-containing protein 2 [Hyalella azteca]|uniref:Armadillo repeat-containing protein 2 n=1 Tax=Hyalella azteca TaxID=294128 RepID=A0A8B7N1J7_HYAAZ|nr:armadillo repeat-containing protein 2 [Hyalella azteca]